jgi:hypothetical protein
MNGYSVRIEAVSGRLLILAALFVLAVGGTRTVYKNRSQAIALSLLPLDSSDPARRKVGSLSFLGAWELKSDNGNFGGISALIALKDGRFIGVSDAGTLIGFGLKGDRSADRPFIAALPGAFGPGMGYADRDTEGMAYDPTTGRIWISYEMKHAIKRFPPSMARIDGSLKIPGTQNWYKNSGIEALARLPDGRFVAIAEGGGEGGVYPAMLYSGDPVEPGTVPFDFRYRPPDGYRATDATPLPDGRLLVLHRRIGLPNGFTAKLGIVNPKTMMRGSIVESEIIATLAPPLLVDNMEGVTITQERGRTIVWLISDNNFMALQRTILMKFTLEGANTKKPEAIGAPGFDSL